MKARPPHRPRSPRSCMRYLVTALISSLLLLACEPAPLATPEPATGKPLTIVLVHGAWGGGWVFQKVQPLLEAAGHTVYRPTLTGLGERAHLASPRVGLTTHVHDIVNLLEFERLDDVVLVAHSYGGMVVAGVADKVPERIARLVFVDAILPESGESVDSLLGDLIGQMARRGGDGYEPWQLVPLWVKQGTPPPVDVPQPALTFSEPIVLENPTTENIPATFILTVEAGTETDDFDVFAERAGARGWTVVEMVGSHNPHWFQPETFVDYLLQVAGSREHSVAPPAGT